MNQTRVFLLFAWLMVAMFLWMQWDKEQAQLPPPEAVVAGAPAVSTVPNAAPQTNSPAMPTAPTLPVAPTSGQNATPATATASATPEQAVVSLRTDVLQLTLDGGAVRSAQLLKYPQTTEDDSEPVLLLDERPASIFVAQSGWVSNSAAAPSHEQGFVPASEQREFVLAPGEDQVSAAFVWTGPDGVSIRRTYTLERGDYAITVHDEVINRGGAPWQGFVYRQLLRDPPEIERGYTNPESFSYAGAAWYSPEEKFEKRKYADFVEDGPLNREVTGGWIGLLQHYFFAAWIPSADATATYSIASVPVEGSSRFLIRAMGPNVNVASGQSAEVSARLWIGPKLQDRLDDVAPGLGLTLDYGIFTFLAKPIAWLLAKFHLLTSNWGWSIVLLVCVIKLILYPLSAAQYKSSAKMRKFQPRIAQLKERYGDDKQKFQMAMMELYKKEKINPVGGCLPLLVQMPVFLALYWVLLESVELRQAVWIPGWIDDLTAPDPFFILPVVNAVVMWLTQKLTPMPGVDPMQQKIMQLMPVVMGVMFALFPAGLVLYWVTNGALGLAQQWWNIKRFSDAPAKA